MKQEKQKNPQQSPQEAKKMKESPADTLNEAIQPEINNSAQGLLQEQLLEITKQSLDFKNKYLTALADAENMRKRLQKEKQEYMEFAKRDLLRDILLPLDQFENALRHATKMSDEVKNWAFGFQMILDQIHEVLKQNKVTSFDTVGHQFDPILHEAIEMIETTDAKPGMIIEECTKGYMIGDSLLRPAKVKVAKEKKESNHKDQTLKGE